MVEASDGLGFGLRGALEANGVRIDAIDDEERVPGEVTVRALVEALGAFGDPDVGLRVAEALRPTALGAFWYLMRNSATLLDAIGVAVEYPRLLSDFESYQLHSADGLCYVTIAFDGSSAVNLRFASQLRIALLARMAGQAMGLRVRAKEIDLPFAVPGDLAVYRRVLGVEPRFRCRRARIAFASADLEAAIPGADPDLLRLVAAYARHVLAALPAPASLAEKVRRVVYRELQGGAATVQQVAQRLGMSSRTLQRRLGESGASFQEIMEEERRRLAMRYLADGALTVSEIGFLLGFSSASAFNHAFKRWSGITPGQHRRQSASAG